jgi:hypothetical protein
LFNLSFNCWSFSGNVISSVTSGIPGSVFIFWRIYCIRIF